MGGEGEKRERERESECMTLWCSVSDYLPNTLVVHGPLICRFMLWQVGLCLIVLCTYHN